MWGHTLSLASLFTIEAGEYANFTFDASAARGLRTAILGLCIGIILAAAYMLYQSLVPGAFVRALLAAEAHDEQSAKTAVELGLGRSLTLGWQLRTNTMLQRVLRHTEGEGEDAEPRYYIPEEEKYRAAARFEKRGNGPVGFAVTVVLSIGIALLLIQLMPAILTAVDKLLG